MEELPWKDRRGFLFSLAETKSDGELAAENPDFAEIQSDLEHMGNASELLKAVSAQVKKNSERINILPKLINENSAKLADIPDISENELAEKCERLQKTIAANNEKIGELKAWKPAESREYLEVKAELCNLAARNEAHKRVQLKEYDRELDEYLNKKRSLQDTLSSLRNIKARCERSVMLLDGRRNELLKERNAISARKWEGGICPSCGQALPPETVEKAKADYERQTAEMLAANAEKGKEIRAELDDAVSENNRTAEEIAKVEKAIEELKGSVPVSNFIPFDLPEFEEEHQRLAAKLEELRVPQAAENPNSAEIERLTEENAGLEREIAENTRLAGEIRKNADLNRRIGELKAEQASLRGEQAKLQKRLDLANAFVRYKTDMVTDGINGMFQTVKFKLFEPNKTNDGLQECCEAVAFGAARYGDINTAGKILAGIDIIGTLSERYGLSVPLFVDNIDGLDDESFTALTERVKGKMQLITLRVSEDAELRTEEF